MTTISYHLSCHSIRSEALLVDLGVASDLTGLHPQMIEAYLTGQLVKAFVDSEGVIYFDPAGISRLRHLVHLRDHEHTSFRMLRYIVTILDRVEGQEQELQELRERIR